MPANNLSIFNYFPVLSMNITRSVYMAAHIILYYVRLTALSHVN